MSAEEFEKELSSKKEGERLILDGEKAWNACKLIKRHEKVLVTDAGYIETDEVTAFHDNGRDKRHAATTNLEFVSNVMALKEKNAADAFFAELKQLHQDILDAKSASSIDIEIKDGLMKVFGYIRKSQDGNECLCVRAKARHSNPNEQDRVFQEKKNIRCIS